MLRFEFDVHHTTDKARRSIALRNDRNTKPRKVDLPVRKVCCQFDKHVLVIQDVASFTVYLAVCAQNADLETVNMCGARFLVGCGDIVEAVTWVAFPFLVHLVSFQSRTRHLLCDLLGQSPWGSACCIWLTVSSRISGHESRQAVVRTELSPFLCAFRCGLLRCRADNLVYASEKIPTVYI